MKRFTVRVAIAALALAVAGAPAMAGGRGGWGGGHGGHGGGYHHYHGGGGGSSDGWWIGGAFALATVGLLLAANSGPSYVQTGVYSSGVGYTSPPLYTAPVYGAPVYQAVPVYEAPPVAYAAPAPQYAPVQYEPAPPVNAAQASATTDCQRWAMNQSGYDPATISQWTTQIMVDTYNRSLDSCMTSRGYHAN
ncbi:hypothetical protein [Achromobacter deleyi]|uniref:hypothetical protein n=1 Tax=Achromobacter deleyi TaxID=1353891 RepID=UPI001491862A|nr:hypothetical protein [Achromobacter deleyi]QVQ27839.1 hypothetical protein HLG70_05180 [Achromobacter deleyi]UIP23447.1 hypothetical protein LYZ39_13295 [Achromobacter deleyi]